MPRLLSVIVGRVAVGDKDEMVARAFASRGWTPALLWLATSLASMAAACGDHDEPPRGEEACAIEPTRTFHERIEPLLVDSKRSTCNQCHLSGVDLSAFARETPCKTMACLQQQGLVDLNKPADSRILSWIDRASPDSDLITKEVIAAERGAFLDWIRANAECPNACAGVSCGDPSDGPTCDYRGPEPNAGTAAAPEVPKPGCSDLEIEQAFMDDVYAWRGRCFPCHFDTELKADAQAPRWLSAKGNCQTSSVTSLRRVLSLGLISPSDPPQSLLLLKPLDESGGGVKHGGGSKVVTADPAYTSFLRFIEYYGSCIAAAP